MANYKELEGFGVQTLATDPDNPGWVGSIFYNSTEGTFKVVKAGGASAGTWASGGNLNTSRYQISGDGSATAAIVAGGDVYPSIPRPSAITEIYNGTSWTEVNDLNNPVQQSRNFGTVTASIAVNNYPTVNTEIWNGTSWSNSPTTLNTARNEGSGTGISTAGLYSGGNSPGVAIRANNETWNGTSWTEVGDLNTGRKTEGSGSQTSAIVVGGAPGAQAVVETWDGTSWTEVADLNTARAENGVAAENNSSAITWCGDIPGVSRLSSVEYYDGTSWTEVANYPLTLRYTGNAGSSSAALGFGGINDDASPATTTSTNEWVLPEVVINTLTTS
jgi:hypothetical protein